MRQLLRMRGVLVQKFGVIAVLVVASVAAAAQMSDAAPNRAVWNESRFSTSTFAPLPDAPSQTRLTDEQKFKLFTEEASSPLTFVSSGFSAGYDVTRRKTYGPGWPGYGKSYAAAVAQHETSAFFGRYLFPALLDQDPRYHPSESEGFFPRATYAASRVLVTRSDSGQKVANTSYLLGALVSSMIANTYRPQRYRGVGATLEDFGTTVGGDAGMNVLREFWPQVRTKLSPMTPKPIKKLTKKFTGGEKQEEEPLSQ